MSRYVFYSHDGYGLGHVRRNSLIARALLEADPSARITLVTGVATKPEWLLAEDRVDVVRVPALLKDSDGAYRSNGLPFEAAVAQRADIFADLVACIEPDVIVVDRHPYGTAGELRRGLEAARQQGASLVLGLRDVLDVPVVIARELAGRGWADVAEIYDRALVYGASHVVDHEAEYGLPMAPVYCGWVVGREPTGERLHRLLVVSAGGGGDGASVFELGRQLLELMPSWRGVVAAGPYADPRIAALRDDGAPRLQVQRGVRSCGYLFGRADAVLCMAGYNSTVEALAAGRRPILVPRRSPRREQAIRAARFAALGLAHVVDEGAVAAEVGWLLRRDHHLPPSALDDAGIRLDGADTAARLLVEMAASRSRR